MGKLEKSERREKKRFEEQYAPTKQVPMGSFRGLSKVIKNMVKKKISVKIKRK
jgi:hypothetical protein